MQRELLIAVMSAAVGAFASLGVASFTYLNKDRELDLEMVRISLSILGGENKDTSAPARRYALKALEEYSGVDIPDDDFSTWAETGTVPPIALSLNDVGRRVAAERIAEDIVKEVLCGGIDPAACVERMKPLRD